MSPQIVYLARGRLQRPRANLIQTLHTVEALTAIGARVRLYTPPVPKGFDMGRLLAEMGIHLPIDIRPTPTLHSRWGGWPFFLLHRRVLRDAGAIYTRVPDFSLQLARFGHPHFLEIHDTEPLADEGYIARLLDAEARGLLRGITVVAAAGRDAMIDAGFRPERIAVIPNGVDVAAFSAVAPPTLEDFATPRAVYVGRISRDRGLPLFERIAEAGFAVTLVGPRDDDPSRPLPTLSVQSAIPHAEVPAALALGAVALMPYQADLRHAASISPIKLFEAMAAGRLVIASDLAPIRELVRDGLNGLLVPADDPAAWIGALERVRADPGHARAMAEAGRQTAREYSWQARAERLLAFCCPNLARQPSASAPTLPAEPR